MSYVWSFSDVKGSEEETAKTINSLENLKKELRTITPKTNLKEYHVKWDVEDGQCIIFSFNQSNLHILGTIST